MKPFLEFIAQVKRIFSFTHERANRLVRFEHVVADYKAGVPVNDIQKKYGCSRNTVLRYARIAGLEKRPKTDDPERRAKIIALAKQGLSQQEIAKRCDCSVALVSVVEGEVGIPRYKRKGKRAA